MPRKKYIVCLKVLPGEPVDGSGRICTHLFVQDAQGLFSTSHAMHPVFMDGVQVKQQVECRPTRGHLACDPRRNPAPVTRNGVTTITSRTDDPRAVTCPKCIASEACKKLLAEQTR